MNKLVDRFPVNPIPANDLVPVRAGYQKCAPGFSFGPTTRDSFTIQYVYSGRGTILKDGRKLAAGVSDCFILRPGETFRLQADVLNPWTYIWIGFRSQLDLPELFLQDVFPAKNMERLFLKIANCNKSSNRPLEPLLLAYTWELIFQFKQMYLPDRRIYKKSEEYVEQACQLIHDRYATLRIEQIAQALHLNRCYLSRIFRESTGTSLQTYLTNTRLQEARQLLLKNHTVSQVSAMVGYSDIACFSRAFKSYYKLSPAQYLRLDWDNSDLSGEDI